MFKSKIMNKYVSSCSAISIKQLMNKINAQKNKKIKSFQLDYISLEIVQKIESQSECD